MTGFFAGGAEPRAGADVVGCEAVYAGAFDVDIGEGRACDVRLGVAEGEVASWVTQFHFAPSHFHLPVTDALLLLVVSTDDAGVLDVFSGVGTAGDVLVVAILMVETSALMSVVADGNIDAGGRTGFGLETTFWICASNCANSASRSRSSSADIFVKTHNGDGQYRKHLVGQ